MAVATAIAPTAKVMTGMRRRATADRSRRTRDNVSQKSLLPYLNSKRGLNSTLSTSAWSTTSTSSSKQSASKPRDRRPNANEILVMGAITV